jgi:hypothetical protein
MKTSYQWLIEAKVPEVYFSTRFLLIAPTRKQAIALATAGFPFGGWQAEPYEAHEAKNIRLGMACEIKVVGNVAQPVYVAFD